MKSTASEPGLIFVSPQRSIHLYNRFYKYVRKIEITKTKILNKADKSMSKKKNILNQTPLSITSRRVSMSITIMDLTFINLKIVHFFFLKSAFF